MNYGIITPWFQLIQIGKKIQVFENDAWLQFCDTHPDMHIAQSCSENISPQHFLFLADEYPALVTHLHTQARIMGSFDLDGSVPRLKDAEDALWTLFCSGLPPENFDYVWHNLQLKSIRSNPIMQIANFTKNLHRQNKVMLLVGGLYLPFDNETTSLMKR